MFYSFRVIFIYAAFFRFDKKIFRFIPCPFLLFFFLFLWCKTIKKKHQKKFHSSLKGIFHLKYLKNNNLLLNIHQNLLQKVLCAFNLIRKI